MSTAGQGSCGAGRSRFGKARVSSVDGGGPLQAPDIRPLSAAPEPALRPVWSVGAGEAADLSAREHTPGSATGLHRVCGPGRLLCSRAPFSLWLCIRLGARPHPRSVYLHVPLRRFCLLDRAVLGHAWLVYPCCGKHFRRTREGPPICADAIPGSQGSSSAVSPWAGGWSRSLTVACPLFVFNIRFCLS